jgi:serine protease
MTFRMPFSVVGLGLAVAAGVAWFGAPAATQGDPLGGRARGVVAARGLEGIDRGLRDLDAPREPAGRGTRGKALVQRADGVAVPQLFLPGSLIVKFRDDAPQAAVFSTLREVGGSSLERPSYADFDIVTIPATADPEAVAAELRARPDVVYAQPRYINRPMFRPNDTFYNRQWNFPALDMERAWDIQPQAGSEITVAVLDSGVAFCAGTLRYNSNFSFRLEPGGPLYPPLGLVDVPFAAAPELAAAAPCDAPASRFVRPRDFIWDDALPVDLDGHGTHVSGTLGQITNNSSGVAGMAFNVRIMPVKVIDETWDFIFGSPNVGTDDTVARGVRYAADNGAQVINMSIGRTGGGPSTVVDEAIRYAVSRGVFVAIAAGNSGDTNNAPSRSAESAPSIAGMVAVAAVGRSLDRAYYSTTNTYVEIAAPGGDLRGGGEGGILQQTLDLDQIETYLLGPLRYSAPRANSFAYYYFQGTSMATPHVTAFAAMLMQQGITNPAAIEAAMKRFARDLGRPGADTEYGSGLIQPRETLRGLGLAR